MGYSLSFCCNLTIELELKSNDEFGRIDLLYNTGHGTATPDSNTVHQPRILQGVKINN